MSKTLREVIRRTNIKEVIKKHSPEVLEPKKTLALFMIDTFNGEKESK